jgi:hypothetical protein
MGHIVNPVGTHVGISYSWRFKFVVYRNCDYKYCVDLQNFFNNFFKNFFNDEIFKNQGVLFLFQKFMMGRGVVNLLTFVQDSLFGIGLRYRWRSLFHTILKRAFLQKKKSPKYYFVRKSRVLIKRNTVTRIVSINKFSLRQMLRLYNNNIASLLINFYSKTFAWFVYKRIALNYLLSFFPQITRSANFFIFVLANTPRSPLFFNATVIARYFTRKFLQRHRLRNLTRPVIRLLSASSLVKGFKLSFSGRFSREERATYEWFKRGAVSLNKFTDLVEYDNDFVSLKFGCVCVKVWINYHRKRVRVIGKRKNFNLLTF